MLDEEGGHRVLRFVPGPIFAQIILADEINRTPPKTQAALLEAMQEYHVTAAGRTYPLERPFFVLATQNPIELEGTYPLPEAQLDRFMFNIVMTYLPEDEEVRVVTRTTGAATEPPSRVLTGAAILEIQQLVRQVAVAEEIARYAVRLVDCVAPGPPGRSRLRARVGQVGRRAARLAGADSRRQGARAAARPLSRVRSPTSRRWRRPVLRHRIIPNFYAESERVTRRSHRRPAARGGAACRAAACERWPPPPRRERPLPRSRRPRPAGDDGAEGADGGGRLPVRAASQPVQGLQRRVRRVSAVPCPATISSTLDWKVYARSDRHYVKKFEEETNLDCHLLLDVSASMAYRGAAPMSKLEYGSRARGIAGVPDEPAAGRDRADRVRPPHRVAAAARGRGPDTCTRCCWRWSGCTPGEQSDLGRPLRQLAASVMKRSLVVLISDLLHDAEPVISGLRHLKARGCDVIVFQVLDPNELTFPFRGPSRFRDLESAAEVTADAPSIRAAYLRELASLTLRYDRELRGHGIDYVQLDTSQPLDFALLAYLCGAQPPQVSGPDLPCRSCSRHS